jgi:predicted glutamine amidotransferase
MHNGGIGGFTKVSRKLIGLLDQFAFDWLMSRGACTDSLVAFAIFLSLLDGDALTQRTTDELRRLLDRTISIIEEVLDTEGLNNVSLLNFCLADGSVLLCTRYIRAPNGHAPGAASLYFACGTNFSANNNGAEGGSKDGLDYRIVHSNRQNSLAIVTSEPLTGRSADWLAVPENHVLIIDSEQHILLAPVRGGGGGGGERGVVPFFRDPYLIPSITIYLQATV